MQTYWGGISCLGNLVRNGFVPSADGIIIITLQQKINAATMNCTQENTKFVLHIIDQAGRHNSEGRCKAKLRECWRFVASFIFFLTFVYENNQCFDIIEPISVID